MIYYNSRNVGESWFEYEYYSNGKIRYEGEFINGKAEGNGKFSERFLLYFFKDIEEYLLF